MRPIEQYLPQQGKKHFSSPDKGHPYRNTVRVIKGRGMMIQVSRVSVTKTWWAPQRPKGCLLWRIPLPIFRNLPPPPPECILRFFTEDKIRLQYQVETNLHDHVSIFLQMLLSHSALCLYLSSKAMELLEC